MAQAGESSAVAPGECGRCRHAHRVRSGRGGIYYLCRRAQDDPTSFPRYPRLPVRDCAGFEPDELE